MGNSEIFNLNHKVSVIMDQQLIKATIDAIKSINSVRLFKSERGYQGRLFCELQFALDSCGIISEDIILEMEYQKSHRHSLTQRPDIILHVPTEISRAEVHENNFAVWALKRQASQERAIGDFIKLDEMFSILQYPIGFYININSKRHYLECYQGNYPDRIIAFAVYLNNGDISLKEASIQNNSIIEKSL